MNQSVDELSNEIQSLKKTIEELKIEENVFNGISIDLYANQRKVEVLTFLLMDVEQIISELLKTNKIDKNKFEKLLEEIKIYTS